MDSMNLESFIDKIVELVFDEDDECRQDMHEPEDVLEIIGILVQQSKDQNDVIEFLERKNGTLKAKNRKLSIENNRIRGVVINMALDRYGPPPQYEEIDNSPSEAHNDEPEEHCDTTNEDVFIPCMCEDEHDFSTVPPHDPANPSRRRIDF